MAGAFVKVWLLLATCMLAWPACAGDWRETLSPPHPGKFPLPRPVRAIYRLGWGGVTAAESRFELRLVPRGQSRMVTKTQTVGFVRTLWRLDAEHTASCDAASFRPMRLQQTEIYKNETEATEAEFSVAGVVRRTHVTPLKGSQEKERRFEFPNVFDLQTAWLFVRSQPLLAGERYRLMVYPSTSAYYTEIEVLGREKLKVAGGSFEAIKCEVRLQGVAKNFDLKPQKKFKRAFAWLSDDRDRVLLKIEAEIFVGRVWAELQSVEFDPKS